jgi:hypothetical protein
MKDAGMAEKNTPSACPFRAPGALFLGDFGVGKSAVINALLRREALNTSREESMALPTFVTRGASSEAAFAALGADGVTLHDKEHDEFLVIRQDRNNEPGYLALAALFPATPFRDLVLIDTAGTSSETARTVDVERVRHTGDFIMVITADIEYWNARHTMDFIAAQQERFGGHMLLVANKADHLNAPEIRRIREKAPARMRAFGIANPPPFFAVSARLESARQETQNEYRHRTRHEVREMCDAGFDALRVALYEFEASKDHSGGPPAFEDLFAAQLAAPFIEREGSVVV